MSESNFEFVDGPFQKVPFYHHQPILPKPTLQDDRCEDRRIAMAIILRCLRKATTAWLNALAEELKEKKFLE